MDPRRRLAALSSRQVVHERVMRAVILRMQDTPYVLKGGTALAFAYDLDRHSTDIDFDAAEPLSIRGRIRQGLADAEVRLADMILHKNTELGQRLKVHYLNPETKEDCLMNVDMSFREIPNEDDIAVVRGIRTYKIEAIFDQKLRAARQRTVGRDLYDLAFIADTYGDRLSSEQIARGDEFSSDYEGLYFRYDQAFGSDRFLSKISTAQDRALMLRIAIEERIIQRSDAETKQVVQGQPSFSRELAQHRL